MSRRSTNAKQFYFEDPSVFLKPNDEKTNDSDEIFGSQSTPFVESPGIVEPSQSDISFVKPPPFIFSKHETSNNSFWTSKQTKTEIPKISVAESSSKQKELEQMKKLLTTTNENISAIKENNFGLVEKLTNFDKTVLSIKNALGNLSDTMNVNINKLIRENSKNDVNDTNILEFFRNNFKSYLENQLKKLFESNFMLIDEDIKRQFEKLFDCIPKTLNEIKNSTIIDMKGLFSEKEQLQFEKFDFFKERIDEIGTKLEDLEAKLNIEEEKNSRIREKVLMLEMKDSLFLCIEQKIKPLQSVVNELSTKFDEKLVAFDKFYARMDSFINSDFPKKITNLEHQIKNNSIQTIKHIPVGKPASQNFDKNQTLTALDQNKMNLVNNDQNVSSEMNFAMIEDQAKTSSQENEKKLAKKIKKKYNSFKNQTTRKNVKKTKQIAKSKVKCFNTIPESTNICGKIRDEENTTIAKSEDYLVPNDEEDMSKLVHKPRGKQEDINLKKAVLQQGESTSMDTGENIEKELSYNMMQKQVMKKPMYFDAVVDNLKKDYTSCFHSTGAHRENTYSNEMEFSTIHKVDITSETSYQASSKQSKLIHGKKAICEEKDVHSKMNSFKQRKCYVEGGIEEEPYHLIKQRKNAEKKTTQTASNNVVERYTLFPRSKFNESKSKKCEVALEKSPKTGTPAKVLKLTSKSGISYKTYETQVSSVSPMQKDMLEMTEHELQHLSYKKTTPYSLQAEDSNSKQNYFKETIVSRMDKDRFGSLKTYNARCTEAEEMSCTQPMPKKNVACKDGRKRIKSSVSNASSFKKSNTTIVPDEKINCNEDDSFLPPSKMVKVSSDQEISDIENDDPQSFKFNKFLALKTYAMPVDKNSNECKKDHTNLSAPREQFPQNRYSPSPVQISDPEIKKREVARKLFPDKSCYKKISSLAEISKKNKVSPEIFRDEEKYNISVDSSKNSSIFSFTDDDEPDVNESFKNTFAQLKESKFFSPNKINNMDTIHPGYTNFSSRFLTKPSMSGSNSPTLAKVNNAGRFYSDKVRAQKFTVETSAYGSRSSYNPDGNMLKVQKMKMNPEAAYKKNFQDSNKTFDDLRKSQKQTSSTSASSTSTSSPKLEYATNEQKIQLITLD